MRGPKHTRIPDFDRLVVRSGHDLGPVWGKCHRADVVTVRVLLLALELQLQVQREHLGGAAERPAAHRRGLVRHARRLLLEVLVHEAERVAEDAACDGKGGGGAEEVCVCVCDFFGTYLEVGGSKRRRGVGSRG